MKTYKEFRKSIGFPVKERKVEEIIRPKESLKEDVVDQLRTVVKKKKESDIKFKSGTSVPIDPEAAKVILKTFDSLKESRPLVASSRTINSGSFNNALAIPILCFSPPEIFCPSCLIT